MGTRKEPFVLLNISLHISLNIAVHYDPTVNFLFFGQLPSTQVSLIHVISATARRHEVAMFGSQTGREMCVKHLIS